MPDSGDLSYGLQQLLSDVDIWRARTLISAVELDIFSILEDGGNDVDAVSTLAGTEREATHRLLRALSELGYLKLDGAQFRNTPVTATFLAKNSSYYLGSWLNLQAMDWPAWGQLSNVIRGGDQPVTGSIFHDPARLRVLLKAAHERARIFHLAPLLAAIDLTGVKTLIDIGGGVGTYSLGLCEAYPDLRCMVFDLPAAIEIARELTSPFRCERLQMRAGDFLRDELGGPFDAALLSNVLHGENPGNVEKLLIKIKKALRPGGILIMRDSFLNENGINNIGGAVFGLTLMVETPEGRTYRRTEVDRMLRTAGFSGIEFKSEMLAVACA